MMLLYSRRCEEVDRFLEIERTADVNVDKFMVANSELV